jgi:hypothetical protein
VARRRYRSDALSSAAKTRPDEPLSTPESYPLGSEPAPPSAPAPDTQAETKPQHDASSLKAQIEQQRYYQQQQANPVFRYLASIPGLSARQVHYLTAYFTSYPDKLNAEHWGTIADAHHRALAHGIAPDSDQYFQFVNAQLHQQPPSPPPTPPAAPMPEPVHAAHVDIETEHSEPQEPPMSHYAAPVSRGSDYAVESQLTASSVRLSAEQRDMAHRSMPHLSADEAEKSYAANLLKMQKMQKSGLIK